MDFENTLKSDILDYIITFLLGKENEGLAKYIRYGLPDEISHIGIYIEPSGFFDKEHFMKKTLCPEKISCDGIAGLFGRAEVENCKNYIICHVDLIATSFFLISRYEEYVRRDCRDIHGRMIGRESAMYKAGLLQEPILDQYGKWLRMQLKKIGIDVKEPEKGVNKIYLTHDIDEPWSFPSNIFLKTKYFLWECLAILFSRNPAAHRARIKNMILNKKDQMETFRFLLKTDSSLKKLWGDKFDSIYFLMVCKKGKYDFGYITEKSRTRKLVSELKKKGGKFGIHISYYAGENPRIVERECKKYRKFMGERAKFSRHHYLMCREPEDYWKLIENGITDDFSLCYADGGGFRFGTCRPVNWIDPVKMQVTELMLHPLFVTEGKLCPKEYMGFSYEEAVSYIKTQIQKIWEHNGEVVVLFHNNSVSNDNKYRLRDVYLEMINYLKEMYG